MTRPRVLLSWSSGKDSAWALHTLRMQDEVDVVGLLTTVNETHERVAMHAVRRTVLKAQAQALGLPLIEATIPYPCSNEQYELVMRGVTERALRDGITHMAFGDLYLKEVRAYREEKLEGTGLKPIFPLWGMDTAALAKTIIEAGVLAHLTCVDPKQISPALVGTRFDHELLAALPETADPCGENGEFHTFVSAGPMFKAPVDIVVGERIERDGFHFADILLHSSSP
jgi:uncharacterized protein (TIGR00290 family)